MKPTMLFRKDINTEREMEIAKKYFTVSQHRNDVVLSDSLVVGRYSVLPYYKELSEDLFLSNSKLINSYFEHSYIADLGAWYEDLKEFTPETIEFRDFNMAREFKATGSFVVKGQTNSLKNQWRTKMFAKTSEDVTRVALELMDDGLTCDQKVYVRKYVPLKRYFTGINGQPIVEEYRFFMYKDKVLASGFYWSSHYSEVIDCGIQPNPDDVPREFIAKLANIVKEKANFYVMDIAKTETGDWILIELNDGQMSGLSEVRADELYKNLAKELET